MQKFIPAGIHHILIGPDHLLFLIGLVARPVEAEGFVCLGFFALCLIAGIVEAHRAIILYGRKGRRRDYD